MSGPKKLTPLPPGPLSIASADTRAKSELRYVELHDEGIDAPRSLNVRVLPTTYQIQEKLGRLPGGADRSEEIDFDRAEQEAWGNSSRMVKKVPADASVDDADEYRSAVLSEDKEIISQG